VVWGMQSGRGSARRVGVFCRAPLVLVCMTAAGTLESATFTPDYLAQDLRPVAMKSKYCGAYAVWHTLHLFGIDKGIEEIVGEMKAEEKDGSSMADVVQALHNTGLGARGVKLRPGQVHRIKNPFVVYLPPSKDGTRGHFVLCVPAADKKAVVIDGAKRPWLIDLKALTNPTARAGWDGSVALVDGDNTSLFSRCDYRLLVLLSALGLVVLFAAFLVLAMKGGFTKTKARERSEG